MEVALSADVTPRRFSRAEFDRLVELGFFEDERVELLYGVLVTMTMGTAHAHLVMLLNDLLTVVLHGRAYVRVQSPVAASDESEPEPDFAIVPRQPYLDDHPATAIWDIEVADSTLEKDRKIKAPLYAQTHVPEYWIVNVQESVIEVYSQPVEGLYQRTTRHGAGETISPSAFPDVRVSIDELFKK